MRTTSFRRYRMRTALKGGLVGLFATLGVAMTIAEVSVGVGLPESPAWFAVGLALAVVLGLLQAVRIASDLEQFSVVLAGGGRVTVHVGDFVDNVRRYEGAACAFGSNDEFSVRGLRSDSAHASFLAAFFSAWDEDTLQVEHDRAIAMAGLDDDGAREPSQARRFPYGTVVCLPFAVDSESDTRSAFLVANSTRQAHGFLAESGVGVVEPIIAVHRHHEDARIHSRTAVFSLIGTGHSRARNPMQSIFQLIDDFMALGRRTAVERRSIEHLVISVPSAVVLESGFDLEAVHKYLDARARIEAHQRS